MKRVPVNSAGVQLGPNAYVLCQHCGLEAQDVSREVCREYAYHVKCKPEEFGYKDQQARFQEFLKQKEREHGAT